MKKTLLVTLADEGYIDQAKQLFSSAYWNAGWNGDYMLLAFEIPEHKLRWFKDKGIFVKKCRPIFKDNNGRRSILTAKFYMFTPEFKKWENIAYIDSDIIVRGSLDALTKIQGFAAVPEDRLKDQFKDIAVSDVEKNALSNLKENYNLEEPRFNSGVMAFNTKIIDKSLFTKLKILFNSYKGIILLNDQPILNLIFYKKWQKLPLCYNVSPYLLAHPYFIKNIKKFPGVILHFIGKRKSWDKSNPFFKEWKHNLEIAEFINVDKPMPAKAFDKSEIISISKRIRMKMILYRPIRAMDRLVGLFGLALKGVFPKIYENLKKTGR
jgi:lipopolysaccharide biosynthesis glycosyltransferase